MIARLKTFPLRNAILNLEFVFGYIKKSIYICETFFFINTNNFILMNMCNTNIVLAMSQFKRHFVLKAIIIAFAGLFLSCSDTPPSLPDTGRTMKIYLSIQDSLGNDLIAKQQWPAIATGKKNSYSDLFNLYISENKRDRNFVLLYDPTKRNKDGRHIFEIEWDAYLFPKKKAAPMIENEVAVSFYNQDNFRPFPLNHLIPIKLYYTLTQDSVYLNKVSLYEKPLRFSTLQSDVNARLFHTCEVNVVLPDTSYVRKMAQ